MRHFEHAGRVLVLGNYWKGFLHVFLNGVKLKGEWLLKRDSDRGEQAWALVKVGSAARRVSRQRDDASALSGRTMAEIAAARDAEWRSNRSGARGH